MKFMEDRPTTGPLGLSVFLAFFCMLMAAQGNGGTSMRVLSSVCLVLGLLFLVDTYRVPRTSGSLVIALVTIIFGMLALTKTWANDKHHERLQERVRAIHERFAAEGDE